MTQRNRQFFARGAPLGAAPWDGGSYALGMTVTRLSIAFFAAALLLGATAGCGRLAGRQLRFHDLREAKSPRERWEGGREVESPARRTAAARPQPWASDHRPLDGDGSDADIYRAYLRAAGEERRRRYGAPATRPVRRRKKRKVWPSQSPRYQR